MEAAGSVELSATLCQPVRLNVPAELNLLKEECRKVPWAVYHPIPKPNGYVSTTRFKISKIGNFIYKATLWGVRLIFISDIPPFQSKRMLLKPQKKNNKTFSCLDVKFRPNLTKFGFPWQTLCPCRKRRRYTWTDGLPHWYIFTHRDSLCSDLM